MRESQYEGVLKLNRRTFRRRTGIYPETFLDMLKILQDREGQKKRSGRPAALSLGDQLLLTLEFWREYRTFFHMGQAWGLDETTVQRTIERVEDALLSSGQFTLPGKKALKDETQVWAAVLVDVTEVPCERPQKNKNSGTAGRKSVTP